MEDKVQGIVNKKAEKSIHIADFCDIQLFEQMIKDWTTCTGLAAVAVDADGRYIIKYHNFTDFCQNLTRKTPEGLRRCAECDRSGKGIYICHAGLVDFATAITLEDGTILGNMLGGQVLPQEPDEAKYRATARELGIDEDKYIEALRKVNVRTPEEIQAAARLLGDVVNMFVRTSWNAHRDAKILSDRAHIISSLSKIYFCTYYVDVEADTYLEIDAISNVHKIVGVAGKVSTVLATACSNFVDSKYQKEFAEFIDISTLRERIGNRHSINFEFIDDLNQWCRATLIVVNRDTHGNIGHVLFAIQDIQEEKEKDLQIRETLRKAANEANRANRVKTDFLARMSHDMRTPLTTIIGLTDIAQEQYTDEETLKYFHTIKESSEFLLSILTDILDMQKLSSGMIKLQPTICHNSATANMVERIIRPQAKEKGITLITDFRCQENNCYFSIDTKRVQQIIMNLLNNAVKYTQPGGEIHWNCRIVSDDKDWTIIQHTISDNGPGMSEEFMKIMYEPFTQVHASPADNGHGLGLAIVKKLVDLIGGSITCKSALGKGTTFVLTVPHAKASETDIAAYKKNNEDHEADPVFQNCKILVCEDNKINAEIIKKILQMKKISVDVAPDGGQGVAMAENNKYDAILMDIRMPVLDGYAATRKIRLFNPKIPIVALSANNFPEDRARSLMAGMNAHLAKPIDIKQLFATLHELLG
jgi:signal transduction histidine kinase/CheY-like chemotaxis protein/ligand-binding sensor protein